MSALLETLGIEADTHVVMYVLKHPFSEVNISKLP